MRKAVFVFAFAIISAALPAATFESWAEQTLRGTGIGKEMDGKDSSVSPLLRAAAERLGDGTVSARQLGAGEDLLSSLVKVNGEGKVEVYVYFSKIGESGLEDLYGLGFDTEIVNEKLGIAQGWLPPGNLERAAALGFVDKITEPVYGHTRAGSVTSEGDALMHADEAREVFGVDGSGVIVGVISDGVDRLAVSQSTGDLPDTVLVGNPGEGDEGTAILEIVHDVAPGAGLAFYSGLSSLQFIPAIDYFTANGVDVIIDDIGFLTEPTFQDGSVATRAGEAVEDGIVFISAAGNDAHRHYQAVYLDIDPGDPGNNLHDFGARAGEESDGGMTFQLGAGQRSVIILHWSNPYGSGTDDYDLYLLDSETLDIIDTGVSVGAGIPVEVAQVENIGSSAGFFEVVIDKVSGEAQDLEILVNRSGTPTEYNVPADSVYGHAAQPLVIAVGATDLEGELDFFSSRGPSTIYFGPVNTTAFSSLGSERLAPVLEERDTPTLTAPNRVSTTVPGFSPFAGTSAAAPHAAGVAALVLEALGGPGAPPEQVREILITTTDGTGFNYETGYGAINAFTAVEEAVGELPTPSPTPVPTSTPEPTNPPSNGGGGGGGCSIPGAAAANLAGNAVNMLIMFAPAALFGLGALGRRRGR
ncbi:MAG: S8 family serine peptidase [Candidatus Dadabacteria bacterium]|nr:S8 family serine peptidase [Candidatus Dadabacteria bacterium]